MDSIERIERRTYRYWYEDGLADLATGWVFGMVGIFFLIQALAPAGPLTAISALVLPVVVIAGTLMARRAVSGLKARITYPRTGFVAYRKPKRNRRWLTGLVGGIMAMLVTLFARLGPGAQAWIPMLTGLVIGAAFLYIGQRFNLTRYHALAAVSALAGAAGSIIAPDETAGSAAFFLTIALGLLIGGGLTLWAYLRRTGVSDEEAGHGG